MNDNIMEARYVVDLTFVLTPEQKERLPDKTYTTRECNCPTCTTCETETRTVKEWMVDQQFISVANEAYAGDRNVVIEKVRELFDAEYPPEGKG